MKNKKQKAFLELYEPVHEAFEKFCRARAFADMPYEDLMNESLLVAFKQMGYLRKKESFLPFLIGISRRILANKLKKKNARAVVDYHSLQQIPDPEHKISQQTEVAFLHYALSQLPAAQREALILFEITGFSLKEIMEIQNVGLSALKQRLARGRKALALIVKKELENKGTLVK